MKIKKYLLALIMLFGCILTVNAEEKKEGPFYFDWENSKVENGEITGTLLTDSFAFKDGSVSIKTVVKRNTSPKIELERRDLKGNVVATNTIKDALFFSGISDENNIYIVKTEDTSIMKDTAGDSANIHLILVKLDENLKVVKELDFDESYDRDVSGMIIARLYGYNILAINDGNLYVFCGEEYMLKTSLDLKDWENMQFSKTKFSKYFPDLSAQYDLQKIWMDKFDSINPSTYPTNYIDIEATTHIYENNTITSGLKFYFKNTKANSSLPLVSFIRITDNTGKVIFE